MADQLQEADAPSVRSAASARGRACVLGVPLDMVTLAGAARHISAAAAAREPLFISTVNVNFLALSHRSEAFRDSLWASGLCTADGIAVLLLCRLLGVKMPERVAGSDFLHALAAAEDARPGKPLTVFFFGGTEEAGAAARQTINGWNAPNLRCLGSLSPGFGGIEEMSAESVIAAINQAAPDFLIVALGAEKGQAWIMRNRPRLEAPVVSHLGATINFLAGSVKRAPRRVQALGFEWLWRIKEERHLAARYWRDGIFLGGLLLTRALPLGAWLLWNRRRWPDRPLGIAVDKLDQTHTRVTLTGTAAVANADALTAALSRALSMAPHVTVDLGGLLWADLHAMASLQDASLAARRQGARIDFTNASSNLRKGLSLNGLDGILEV